MIQTCAKHFATCREHGSSSIDKIQRQPSEKNTWAKAAAGNINNNARGSQATSGRQQPPPGGNPRQPNHPNYRNPQDLPIEDLCQKINEGRDARSIIDSRRGEREVANPEGTDYSDRFPAFTAWFNSYKYSL
jgi:hypothetical protein